MVESQIKSRGVSDERVLAAMLAVPRVAFVPPEYRQFAYADCPLPIPSGQTISQPYMVAAMSELLKISADAKVLEVGTGCGYQTAVLAKLAGTVYTVEILESLARGARQTLDDLGYANIHFKIGDGWFGWAEHGPFDAIMVTAAPDEIPSPLLAQLKPGGRMVIPVGPEGGMQYLHLVEKTRDGEIQRHNMMAVRFVPLTGDH
ncbi:protein-L-isoaspartate(D-aspartate) O-methyltransferase [Acanthopleuribacter pedis]|uniref:Protein-L-isoaspartate O-methyltransferase n=2 Tax=Acanthopleuribacter pedis TaxID=442870 RepID=A0A8J7QB37_9BACT|nr:protein-L-isoaspartate(D-aspartate) O-methyltransferase [Acanthopleuribacter pedis]